MTIGAPWALVRLLFILTIVIALAWKYRANRVITFGVITLGCAALALVLGLIPGVPYWLIGVVVAIFLLLAVAMVPVICFYVVRYLRRKPQTHVDDLLSSNHAEDKKSKLI
jgi:hypothetical protein